MTPPRSSTPELVASLRVVASAIGGAGDIASVAADAITESAARLASLHADIATVLQAMERGE